MVTVGNGAISAHEETLGAPGLGAAGCGAGIAPAPCALPPGPSTPTGIAAFVACPDSKAEPTSSNNNKANPANTDPIPRLVIPSPSLKILPWSKQTEQALSVRAKK